MYSPNKPKNSKIIPAKKRMVAIIEEYPRAISGCKSFRTTITIPNKNPNADSIIPVIDAKRNGFSEKAVKPFIHSFNKLVNLYPDVPLSRSLCIT